MHLWTVFHVLLDPIKTQTGPQSVCHAHLAHTKHQVSQQHALNAQWDFTNLPMHLQIVFHALLDPINIQTGPQSVCCAHLAHIKHPMGLQHAQNV